MRVGALLRSRPVAALRAGGDGVVAVGSDGIPGGGLAVWMAKTR